MGEAGSHHQVPSACPCRKQTFQLPCKRGWMPWPQRSGPLAQTNCLCNKAGWVGLDFAQGMPGFQILGTPDALSSLRSFGSQKPEASGPHRATPDTGFNLGCQAEVIHLRPPLCAATVWATAVESLHWGWRPTSTAFQLCESPALCLGPLSVKWG